jgi:putative hydrolase of the HAD superfamily
MMTPHEGTNKEAFDTYLYEKTGISLDEPAHNHAIESFYREVFPALQGNARPMSGARTALLTCKSRGLPFCIATQPIFPALAIEARLNWAELGDLDLPFVSTYENSYATKPHLDYFAQMAQEIGVDPSKCVMVGDDPLLDMSAAHLGMMTFYVGDNPDVDCTWRGSMRDFTELIQP